MRFADIIPGLVEGRPYRRKVWGGVYAMARPGPNETIRFPVYYPTGQPQGEYRDVLTFTDLEADDWEPCDWFGNPISEDDAIGRRPVATVHKADHEEGIIALELDGYVTCMEEHTARRMARDILDALGGEADE